MWPRIRKFALGLPVLVPAGLFALYLLAGFFLVNPLAQKLLPWAGERMLASRLSADRVDFHPLTLELRVRGLVLAEADGKPLAGLDSLYANLEASGLARWALRIQSLQVERPRGRIELRPGGRSNWSALAARLREDAGPPSDTMLRVLLNHIRVAGGEITYVDADRAGEPFATTIAPLGLELDGISTLPEDRGDYLVAARLPQQGATLRWKGELALNPLASHGELSVEGARIGRLVPFLRGQPALDAGGTLAGRMPYRFAMLRGEGEALVPSLVVAGASLQVSDFALGPRGGAPLLELPRLRVEDAGFDLLRRALEVGSVHLDGGKLAATRDARGALDWQSLSAAPTPAQDPPAALNGPAAAPWQVTVRDLRLAGWSLRWTDQTYAAPLGVLAEGAELHASLGAAIGATTTVAFGPVHAAAGPVQLISGAAPVAHLRRAALANAQLQWPQQRIRVESVALDGARAAVEIDKERRLNWDEILRKVADAPIAPATTAAPPDLQVARVVADDIELQVTDASTATPVRLDLIGGRIALANVGLDLQRAIPLDASIAVKQGGRLQAKGQVVPGQTAGRLDLQLAGLALQPFAPYVNTHARLRLQSGTAATRGKLVFGPGKAGLALQYNGGFALDELAITEEDTGEPFLGWKQLASDSVHFTLGPDRLQVGELVATQPLVKLIIFEDQTLNLQRIRRTDAAAAAPAPPAADAPAFPVAIERLRVVGANAEFADLSLRPQFGTRMHDLGGVVTGLSTERTATAQVELDGKVDDYGSARIRGSIQPFRATESTDLALAFRNLEMTRLTPYSGKFAGRRIESGRLSVDLQYKIQQRQLAGANKFVVTRLKLGEAVDSADAVKLPLDLAIALLEDSNGVIDLDLPVAGSLDDPQFSYGAIVWKAVVNVLTKLVTAPFRALAGLLGADADKLEAVAFEPGSSSLRPPEQEKLKLLADALAKRPALTVTIAPGYDPEADRRALQEAAMRRQAAAAAGLQVAAGENPGPVDVNNHKVQTWLEDEYQRRAGAEEYRKLRASFQDPKAGAVTRVMDSEFVERMGRRFKTRDDGPASAFHAELLERLTRQQEVADAALLELAQQRAGAMRASVVQWGLAQERVAVGAPAQQAAKDREVASALQLGAGRGPAAPPARSALVPGVAAVRVPGHDVGHADVARRNLP